MIRPPTSRGMARQRAFGESIFASDGFSTGLEWIPVNLRFSFIKKLKLVKTRFALRPNSIRQIHTRHRHCGDAFLAANETHFLIRRRLDADLFFGNAERGGNALLHLGDVRIKLRRLRDEGRVHIHDFAFAFGDLLRRFLQKNFARRIFPARVGVREKVADVRFAKRAEKRVANCVHERIRVRMAVETFGMGNLNAAEDEFASRDQRVNVIANANVNHA